jgi:hypothetical protein
MQVEKMRSTIQPDTIKRLSKYAPVRFGMRADDLINEALDNIEKRGSNQKGDAKFAT